jgi:integration host factor subunit alpha
MTTARNGKAAAGVLTRADLRDAAYQACPNATREDVRKLLDDTLEEITDALARDEIVKLQGFGIFKVKGKGQRIGRNPKTGHETEITPRRILSFKASRVLKKVMNCENDD